MLIGQNVVLCMGIRLSARCLSFQVATGSRRCVLTFCERLRSETNRPSLSLGHVSGTFRANCVDGAFLATLSLEDLVQELGLTTLQARKIIARLPGNSD